MFTGITGIALPCHAKTFPPSGTHDDPSSDGVFRVPDFNIDVDKAPNRDIAAIYGVPAILEDIRVRGIEYHPP